MVARRAWLQRDCGLITGRKICGPNACTLSRTLELRLLERFSGKAGHYYRSKREPRAAMLFAPPNMLCARRRSQKLHPVSYRKVKEFTCESASLC
jgi:hypothetical protein